MTDTTVAAIVGGLIGIGAAIIGSLIGFVGARHLDKRRERSDDMAAARGALIEVATNRHAVTAMGSTGVLVRTTSATWDRTRDRLARLVTPVELARLASYYATLDDLRSAVDKDELRTWASNLSRDGDQVYEILARLTEWPADEVDSNRMRGHFGDEPVDR